MANRWGTIYCFSGPSGSGKTTLADTFRKTSNGAVSRVTTVTTRAPRQGEVDGVDYYFWTDENFRRGIEDGMFFEHQQVHGNYYGTLKGSLEEVVARKDMAVIILDVLGAITLKDRYPLNAVNVFLTCSSKAELRRRIEARNTSPEEVERRLHNATVELQVYSTYHRKFDYLIVNDDLNTSKSSLINITLHEAVRQGRSLTFKDEAYG
jgi:guanylate kinase